MKKNSSYLLALLVLAYCIWNARDLHQSWFYISLYEHYSWIILIIWLLPLLYYWTFTSRPKEQNMNSILLGLALITSLLGVLGSLHILNYIGLALAFAVFVPWSASTWVWLICSFLWMPGSGWIASHLFLEYVQYVFAVRVILAAAASTWLIITFRN